MNVLVVVVFFSFVSNFFVVVVVVVVVVPYLCMCVCVCKDRCEKGKKKDVRIAEKASEQNQHVALHKQIKIQELTRVITSKHTKHGMNRTHHELKNL